MPRRSLSLREPKQTNAARPKCGRLRLDLASSTASNGPDIRITDRGSRMIIAMNWCLSAAK